MKTHDLDFCSRPSLLGQQKLSYNGLDLAFSPYNSYWREIRKICVVHLFNPNRSLLHRPIREDEVARMIEKIYKSSVGSKPIDLSEALLCLTSTIICIVGFGKRYEEEGIERSRFHGLLNEAQAMFGSLLFSDYIPFMGWVDRLSGLLGRLEKYFKDFDTFYQELIDEHLDPNRPKPEQEDFLDVLLQIWRDRVFQVDLTFDHIKAVLMNVSVAGTDTSAETVIWAMTFLMKNPRSMKKVQEEVWNLIGNKSFVDVDEDDIQVGRDPEAWENPGELYPERFIGSSIDYKGLDFELIPFGAGRRGCPGMYMGIATVELALANLLCKFDWEMPVGMNKDDLDFDVIPGVTAHTKNALCLVARKINA
ncbi:hypothetical protein CRYUN_Cryun01aG0008300 [Craigia yunnanensis]